MFSAYLSGLEWVLLYYYDGCPSWSWFYPYHYAPMASGLLKMRYDPPQDSTTQQQKDKAGQTTENGGAGAGDSGKTDGKQSDWFRPEEWEIGKPLRPLEQLMAVLPSSSAHCLPEECRRLMTEDGPLKKFYPENFRLDMNGKKYAYQAVALLPFIDEELLLTEISKIEDQFSETERARNEFGEDFLFISAFHPLTPYICEL